MAIVPKWPKRVWRFVKRACVLLFAALLASPVLNAGALNHRTARPKPRCWKGEVDHLDTIRPLSRDFSLGPWMGKDYRLCWIRVGTSTYELRVMEVTPSLHGVSDSIGDWQSYQQAVGPLELVSELSWQVTVRAANARKVHLDETTRLRLRVEGKILGVRARVYGMADGRPWFVATWHARFRPSGKRSLLVSPARPSAPAPPSQRWLITQPWFAPDL